MNEQNNPKVPVAGIVYGEIIYWGTLAGSIIAIIGSLITFLTRSNYISPSYLLSSIWEGKSVKDLWEGAIGFLPKGHWYLSHLGTGDGLTEAGICLSVSTVIVAMLACSIVLFKEKDIFYGILAISAAFISIISMLGILIA